RAEIGARLAGTAETGLLDVDAMIEEALHALGVAHATEMLGRLTPDAFLDGYPEIQMLVVGPVGMWAGRRAVQVLGAARTAAPRTSCHRLRPAQRSRGRLEARRRRC
ncbi:MAG: hypothetical protein QOK40_1368, partial [Miltoncostaeaceae bacterium]|nr:hypothetical protein [Miltoncostaeaceae bacterium]